MEQDSRKILITGAGGLIGRHLTFHLQCDWAEVVHLSRKENLNAKVKTFGWNLDRNYINENCLEGVTDIIHLAGEGIADKRWSEKRKKILIDSRVKGLELLSGLIKRKNIQLNTFIGASAIGAYGAVSNEKIYSETDSFANDYLGQCCKEWEGSYSSVQDFCGRLMILRLGVVLDSSGGALKKMAGPIGMNIGSPLGSGNQYVPWIDTEDVCRFIKFALNRKDLNGVYNLVAPQHLTNRELSIAIAKRLKKKLWLPAVPSFVLKMMYGEMSGMILQGSRVSAERIKNCGFEFSYPDIDACLAHHSF